MSLAKDWLGQRIAGFHQGRVSQTWGGRNIMVGKVPGPDALILTSNDYLAIAKHPRIVAAMVESLQSAGSVALMSGVFLVGTDHAQIRLENAFASHMGAAAGVICQSGWDANMGLIQTIADADVPVYLDHLAHMSLWRGAHSAQAQVVPFTHNNVAGLRQRLKAYGPGIVVADSVYSTDGSICPLPDLIAVAREHDCLVVIDESHSLGVYGERGEGMVAALGLADQVDFRTASLAKAVPGRAGLIVCNRPDFVDYFKFTSPPAIFSSTLLPHDVAGLAAALEVVREEGHRRERLAAVVRQVRAELRGLGFNVAVEGAPIIALEAGSEADTMLLRDSLDRRGIFGSVFAAPATALRRSLVRLSLHAGLTDPDLQRIIGACADLRAEVGMVAWPSTRKFA